MNREEQDRDLIEAISISDDDVYEAMREISGYIDITPEDFKELYIKAYRHALERLLSSVRAGDIMTSDVVTAKVDTPLVEVASMMGERGISGLPVVDDNRNVLGVISEKDFIAHMDVEGLTNLMTIIAECLKGKGCLVVKMRKATAKDIMTSPAITVTEDTPIVEISHIFSEKKINRIPVLDHNGRLCGIVTRGDIIRGMRRRQGR